MTRTSLIVFTCLFLLLTYSYGSGFTINTESTTTKKASTKTKDSKQTAHANTNVHVVNIEIASITNDMVYAKDGRSFPITEDTKIVYQHDKDVRMVIGELFFQSGHLVMIIVK